MGVLQNKEILKYCPNYYNIINQDFLDSEVVSIKLIQIFQEFVFSIDVNKKEDICIINKMADSIIKYFEDGEFKKELIGTISNLKISSRIDNVLLFIAQKIIEAYDKYLEYYTRNLYIPRWI